MRYTITAVIESIYDAGTYWLDEAAHAVLYLLLAVTFPVCCDVCDVEIPAWVISADFREFPQLSAGFLAFPDLA